MADEKQVALLLESVEKWNAWRGEHPEIVPDLSGAEVIGADLRGADLIDADLQGAKLSRAKLFDANFSGSNLHGADLTDALLDRARLRHVNLHRANLTWAGLTKTDLYDANLCDAQLMCADLRGANIRDARLGGADLRSAILGADFAHADLRQANLSHALLYRAIFRNTNLTDTNLENSIVAQTIFANIDLSVAKGLTQVDHKGPSTIGIDTLYLSKGQIPEAFLRGAGVPDILIAFAKSLVANPIEFYSCFISYSTKDQPFADRLYTDLQANGVRCWFSPHDAQRGRKLPEQIDEAIRVHDKLLLILSPDSMNSNWVKTEITKARKRELAEKTDVLFPIRLVSFDVIRDWQLFDPDTGTDIAREIRQFFIPNFTTWKDHDAYQREFQLLLRDLKDGRRPKAPLLS